MISAPQKGRATTLLLNTLFTAGRRINRGEKRERDFPVLPVLTHTATVRDRSSLLPVTDTTVAGAAPASLAARPCQSHTALDANSGNPCWSLSNPASQKKCNETPVQWVGSHGNSSSNYTKRVSWKGEGASWRPDGLVQTMLPISYPKHLLCDTLCLSSLLVCFSGELYS